MNKDTAYEIVDDLSKASCPDGASSRYEKQHLSEMRVSGQYVHNRIEALGIVLRDMQTRVSDVESVQAVERDLRKALTTKPRTRTLKPGLYQVFEGTKVVLDDSESFPVVQVVPEHTAQEIMEATAFLVRRGCKPYASYGYGNVVEFALQHGWKGLSR